MRQANRLGKLPWWNAVPLLLVAGGFTVIGIAGDTAHRPEVPALEGISSKDGGGDAVAKAASDAPAEPGADHVQEREPEETVALEEGPTIVRRLPDESRRDATGR